MSICNEQAGGFMAALIEYSERPPGLQLLQSLLYIDDDMNHSRILCDMSVHLYRQGLTFNPDKPRSRAISPQVHEKTFFKVLRIVKLDYRIAHFLCQKSEDDRVTAGKMLIAAILASDYGFEPKLLHEVNESFVAKLNDFLLRSYFGIWSFTGYIPFKVAIMEVIVDPRRKLTISNWSPMVLEDLGIQVQGHQIIEVQRKCGLLIQALKESEVPINGMSEFSTIQPPITPARLREIKLHLARAYLHQTVDIYTDEEGFSHAKDKLSGQEFSIYKESVYFLAFKEECQGVYTSLHYSEGGGPRCMSDFTYIDRETLQKLDPEVRDREQSIAKWGRNFAFGSNNHEVC
jgi:hypothetical protein